MSYTGSIKATSQIDYTSVDAVSLKTLLLSRIPLITPEWTDNTESDMGIVLLDLFCHIGDMLKQYQDRTMNEGFIDTVQTLDAMKAICNLIGYYLTPAQSATVQFVFLGQLNPVSQQSIRVPQGTQCSVQDADGSFIYFETTQDIYISLLVNTYIVGFTNATVFRVYDPTNSGAGITPGMSIYVGGINNVNAVVSSVVGNTITLTAALPNNPSANDQVASIAGSYASYPVTAYEGQTHYQEPLGYSDNQPNLTFTLQYPNVLDDNANGGQALSTDPNQVLIFVNEGSGANLWTEVEDFTQSGPNDTVYCTQVLSNGQMQIIFNDGKNGRIPAYAASITATYRTGGGTRGNIPANTPLTLNSQITNGTIVGVFSYTAGSGGTDAETIDQARSLAPASLTTLNRAVTAQDIADLIGISDSSVIGVQVTTLDWNTALAYILTNYMTPSSANLLSGTINNITNYLSPRLMATEGLSLSAVTLVPIYIGLTIYVASGYYQATVQSQVLEYLLDYFTLGNIGVGSPVNYSNVIAGLESAGNPSNIQGIDHFDLTMFNTTGAAGEFSDVQISIGSVAVVTSASITLNMIGGS